MMNCNCFRLIFEKEKTMAEGGYASSTIYSNSEVNEEYLRSLMEMGIHRDDARQVVLDCFDFDKLKKMILTFKGVENCK